MLSDSEFFLKDLNPEIPELARMRRMAEAGDYAGARRGFAAYLRKVLPARKALYRSVPYEEPENIYKLPGESDEEACRRVCAHTLVSVGTPMAFGEKGDVDWTANPTQNGYREWTWQLNRHNDVKMLARQYALTGDRKLAACAQELLWSWMKTAPCPPESVPGTETKCWRTIECGIRMGANWPYIFFALCDTFSDDFLTDWYKSVEEHGERLEHCRTHGNWLIMEMNGLTQCGILYPELARAGHWKQTGWQVLSEELSRQVYPDGFQYELTTGYHHVLVNNYERLLLVARAMKEEGPASIGETLGKAARVYWKLVRPDGKTPDINDGKADKIAPQLARIEEVIPRNEQTHWFATDGKEGARPDETSLSLPYSGFVIFRTGWERGDTWALFDAAPFGRGHQHEDKLNFLLYAHGKNLLTEGGNYAYDSSRMRAYVTSTSSHNTGVVDGLGQSRRNSYRWHAYEIHRPAPMAARFSDTVDFARGIYDEGYAPEQTTGSFESCLGNPNRIAAGEAAQERCVYFIRKPGALSEALAGLDPFFILVDRFYGASPHTYETLWHVDDDPAAFFGESLEIDDISANAGESPCKMAAFRNLSLLFGGAVSDISDVFGQEEPVWQGFTARSAIQGDFRPVHCVMAKAEGKNVRMITVVLPHGEKAQHILKRVSGGDTVWDRDIRLLVNNTPILLDETKL